MKRKGPMPSVRTRTWLFLPVSLVLFCALFASAQIKSKTITARTETNRTTPTGWKRRQFIEAGYSISIPPGAKFDEENNVRLLAASTGGDFKDKELNYSSQITDLKLFPQLADDKKIYGEMLEMVQSSYKGENRTLHSIVHRGVKGYEYEYEAFELSLDFSGGLTDVKRSQAKIVSRFKGRYFIVDNQVYALTVMYKRSPSNLSKLASINQRINTYLDSLEWLANPERENYGVMDNYLYANKNLGFSIKFNELPDAWVFWYFRQFGILRPTNWTKDKEPVAFVPVPEPDGSFRLLSTMLVTAGEHKEQCLLTLKLVRAIPGSDAKGLALALQKQIAKANKIEFTNDIPEPECKTFDGQPGCGFAFNEYDEARAQDLQKRFYFIKLSETAYLRLDWGSYDKDLERQIENPLGEFRMLK